MRKIRYLLSLNNIRPDKEAKTKAGGALKEGFDLYQKKSERTGFSDIFTRKLLIGVLCVLLIGAAAFGGVWLVSTANEWADHTGETTGDAAGQKEEAAVLYAYPESKICEYIKNIHASVVISDPTEGNIEDSLYGSVASCFNADSALFSGVNATSEQISDVIRTNFAFIDADTEISEFPSDRPTRSGSGKVFFGGSRYTPECAVIGCFSDEYFTYILVTDLYVSDSGAALSCAIDTDAKNGTSTRVYQPLGSKTKDDTYSVDPSQLTTGTLYKLRCDGEKYVIYRVSQIQLSDIVASERVYGGSSSEIVLTVFECPLKGEEKAVSTETAYENKKIKVAEVYTCADIGLPYVCDTGAGERRILCDIQNNIDGVFYPLYFRHVNEALTLVIGYLCDGKFSGSIASEQYTGVIHMLSESALYINSGKPDNGQTETTTVIQDRNTVYVYDQSDADKLQYYLPKIAEELFAEMLNDGVEPLTEFSAAVPEVVASALDFPEYKIYCDYSKSASPLARDARFLFGRELSEGFTLKRYVSPAASLSDVSTDGVISEENSADILPGSDFITDTPLLSFLLTARSFSSAYDTYTQYVYVTFSSMSESGILFDERGTMAGLYNSATGTALLFCSPYALTLRVYTVGSDGYIKDISSTIYGGLSGICALSPTDTPEISPESLSLYIASDGAIYPFDEVYDGIYAQELCFSDGTSGFETGFTPGQTEQTENGVCFTYVMTDTRLTKAGSEWYYAFCGNLRRPVIRSQYGDCAAFSDNIVNYIYYVSRQAKPGAYYKTILIKYGRAAADSTSA